MKTLRLSLGAILAGTLLPLAATPAMAAPPGNDEPAGALTLKLADQVVQDTSQATTSAQDTALSEECGAPATTASVWYTFTPAASRDVVLDMTSSDYSGGFLVFEGAPTVDTLLDCGAGLIGLSAQAGTKYTIMVFSDTDTNGGKLVLSLKPAPPPPRVHVTIAKRGLAFRGGAARIHGTYSCGSADSAVMFGTLVQRAGRLKIPAEFGKEIQCNGRPHNWRARLVSSIGTYDRGRARATVTVEACGFFECGNDSARRRVHLVRAGGRKGQRLVPSVNRTERARPLVTQQRHWPDS